MNTMTMNLNELALACGGKTPFGIGMPTPTNKEWPVLDKMINDSPTCPITPPGPPSFIDALWILYQYTRKNK
jgi:hypothetical protein